MRLKNPTNDGIPTIIKDPILVTLIQHMTFWQLKHYNKPICFQESDPEAPAVVATAAMVAEMQATSNVRV